MVLPNYFIDIAQIPSSTQTQYLLGLILDKRLLRVLTQKTNVKLSIQDFNFLNLYSALSSL